MADYRRGKRGVNCCLCLYPLHLVWVLGLYSLSNPVNYGVPICGTKCGGWALGSWRSAGNPSSPGELQLVEDAVTIISNAMGSPAKFRSAFGRGCTVEQIAKNENNCGFVDFLHPENNTYPYAFTYGGGGPLLEGAGWEDWADSFASFLYSDYNKKRQRTNLVQGGIRELYVRFQIEHIR